MSTDEDTQGPASPADAAPDEEPHTVFGNLPHTRPGARSPRREAPGRSARGSGSRTSGDTDPKPAPAREPAPERSQPEPASAEEADERGIEDVAWAGVAAAAEAATIGVRLATRALEAMRDAVDRR